jgi:hypothetical protein
MAIQTSKSPGLGSGITPNPFDLQKDFITQLFRDYRKTNYAHPVTGKVGTGGGYGFFGFDYAQDLASNPMAQEGKYMPLANESMEEWAARVERDFPGISDMLRSGGSKYADMFNVAQGGQTQSELDKADAAQAERQADMDKFYKSLSTPLTRDDSRVQAITQIAENAAGNMARQRGIGGPMSIHAGQAGVNSGLMGLEAQRQSMIPGAMGMAAQYGAGHAADMYGRGMDAYQMQYDRSLQNFTNNQGLGRGIGSAIGAGLGALGFLVPGAGAAIGPALMAGGSALGGGIGGMGGGGGGFTPPPMPQSLRRFQGQ